MTSLGGTTAIPAGVRLIIIDCFDTLVSLQTQVVSGQKSYVARKGVPLFLEHFATQAKIPVVAISDAPSAEVHAALAQAGIADRLARLYHSGNSSETLPGGLTRKRLDLPLADYGVPAVQAVYIGDSKMDERAAEHWRVPFIRVPGPEDPSFSFKALLHGPSRYSSAEFSAAFVKHYRPDQPQLPDPANRTDPDAHG